MDIGQTHSFSWQLILRLVSVTNISILEYFLRPRTLLGPLDATPSRRNRSHHPKSVGSGFKYNRKKLQNIKYGNEICENAFKRLQLYELNKQLIMRFLFFFGLYSVSSAFRFLIVRLNYRNEEWRILRICKSCPSPSPNLTIFGLNNRYLSLIRHHFRYTPPL